ncbi:MAG: sigma-70 family RNA polymerase sigma factor [Bacteroidales bacterium]|nr:sigma-70 family RNA polymerase sigma factor [Bacteroidales bacterium]
MKETKLIKGCIRKNPIAQRYLFDKYYQLMYHTAMRYLANHHDTEDVLANAFIRVFNNLINYEFRGEGSLEKWIKTIVINESLRFFQKKKPIAYQEDFHDDNESTSYSETIQEIDTELIYQIIENMPEGYRTVFNLFAIEGYSHQEIAEMLSINVNTSKSQLSKARKHIINQMKNMNYGIA